VEVPPGEHDHEPRTRTTGTYSFDPLQTIADAIPFSRDAAIQILDVGAGYGALTQFLLEEFPHTTALCQEGSDEMAKLGRRRMAKWQGRLDYVIADFSKPGWSRAIHGSFDAVVSTIAIHNVRVPGIIEAMYKEVFQLVKPGGCFLNLDLVFIPLAKHAFPQTRLGKNGCACSRTGATESRIISRKGAKVMKPCPPERMRGI